MNQKKNSYIQPEVGARSGYPETLTSDRKEMVSVSFLDLLSILLKNWYWVLISVAVCGTIGVFYAKKQSNIYQRSASVLVKGQNDKNLAISELAALSGVRSSSLSMMSRAVENEMIVMRTEALVEETVKRLNLDINYLVENGLRKDNVYKNTPITVTFIDGDPNESVQLEVVHKDAENFVIKNLGGSAGKQVSSIGGRYGQEVNSPVGKLLVEKTPFFSSFRKNGGIVYVSKVKLRDAMLSYQKSLSVGLFSKESSVIKLTLNSTNPLLAEDFLNTLVQVYSEFKRKDKILLAQATERFVDNRLAIISTELGSVDSEIEKFKQDNRIADISAEAAQYIQGTAETDRRLTDLNNQLSMARFIKDYLTKSNNQELIPAAVGLSDPLTNGQINSYNEVLLRRQTLNSNSGDKNPVLADLDNQLAAMRLAIMKSIDNHINSLNIQTKSIHSQINSNEGRITSVPTQEKVVSSIYRQQKIKEELYLFLLNVREKNALSMEATETDISLIQPATGSMSPIAPKKFLIFVVSLMVGFILSAGYFALKAFFNDKVRGRQDIEDYTSIPFLGEIPRYRSKSDKRRKRSLLEKLRAFFSPSVREKQRVEERNLGRAAKSFIVDSNRTLLTEAFTVARTNLSFMQTDEGAFKVAMIISAIPNSGKSFVSSNMALSMAKAGARVLLMDVDIRKSSLSKALEEVTPYTSRGLTSYLTNSNLQVDDVIVETGFPGGLHFLPAGPVPPNPANMLQSSRLDGLMSELRSRYDLIVMDTAPFLTLADARILNRLVDFSIMVIREGHLPRKLLVDVERIYQERHFNNLSVLLNDAGASSDTYGYGRGYGYGKGYGYGRKYGYGYGLNEYVSDKE